MPALEPGQWQALSPYLDEALELSPERLAAWLESIREQNPSLASDLHTLLKEHEALGNEGFLQASAAVSCGAPVSGQSVGAYALESVIGQGGMGTVWLARRTDGRFEGRAAVKFLKVALVGGAGEERFKREGSILARLAHPNIAHLIDAGLSASGQPYLILEYVEGQQIDRYCEQNAIGLEARIRLFLDVLAAVAHAHANLIVHRDIKPSNVLVTREGQVKLLDFGIAKLLEEETGVTVLTREGERALTPAYAAPEQVIGRAVTTATDVYALGILLYLLLTGKHPAESALQSPADLIKAIVDTEPPRASDLVAPTDKQRSALRGDLDTIVAKALKKNPAERYASVITFAEDLRRYLRHETISARPDSLAYRAKKFVRRNQAAVALATAAFVTTVAGAVSTVIQARTARIERDFALRQLSRAEAINELNSFVLSDAAPSGKPFTVNHLLARAEQLVRKGASDLNRVELLLSIGRQYTVQDEYAKARELLTQAYALARALPDRSTAARTSCALAQALAHGTDLEAAERLIQEGLGELPNDARFALDRVFCLQRGSEVAIQRGQSLDAVVRAEAAHRALSKALFHSEVVESDNLITLAGAYRNAGRVREANAAFEEAAARLAALGRDDTQRASTLFNNWGVALWLWGRPLDSERVLRRAVAVSEDSRAESVVSPMLLLNYGRSLKELERLNEAAKFAELAYAKAKAAGDQTVVNQSLLVRTAIYRSQGDLERAAEMLTELEPMLRRSLPPGHVAFASLALQQALNAQARGDVQKALDLANQVVTIAEEAIKAGREGAGYLQVYLVSRSNIHLQLGHLGEAAADAGRALKILLDASQMESFSAALGRAYLALGRALSPQGKDEEARAAFRFAIENLQSALGADHSETRAARQLLMGTVRP